MTDISPATILVIAGHDPCGGAGIQADIETIRALGGFPATVITTLTVQDSCNIKEIYPVPADLIKRQAEAILHDYPVAAIKIGLLGSAENAHAVAQLLAEFPAIPVVLDTVLAAGGGAELSTNKLLDTIVRELLPHTLLTTPNSVEARRLTHENSLEVCANTLLRAGAQAVLITGGHETSDQVINTLYQEHQPAVSQSWTRLPGNYHGSGCTLAAAIATHLAQGKSITAAVGAAQQFTWETLNHSYQLGHGQLIPNRCYNQNRHDA
ncbi:MAG: bifunctional hydroxymethylpyrimidine kinase/phosphomethylpyrimidine kinase [Sedimenticola sp.]|jgi:hydroxymethylpyrimidine/phosphomethylpyrimidine kinase|nr:MAG: bifunctional hydroxymethylpyrimidine kinase/phosphomethylpyrimidine kinase [Sedimenticola sp.]